MNELIKTANPTESSEWMKTAKIQWMNEIDLEITTSCNLRTVLPLLMLIRSNPAWIRNNITWNTTQLRLRATLSASFSIYTLHIVNTASGSDVSNFRVWHLFITAKPQRSCGPSIHCLPTFSSLDLDFCLLWRFLGDMSLLVHQHASCVQTI